MYIDENQIIVTGRLTATPELKNVEGSDGPFSVANMTIANNYKTRDNPEQQVNFFNVVVYGKTAENCCQYLTKGSKVLIRGAARLTPHKKEGEDKQTYYFKIIAHRIQFLDTKPKTNNCDAPGMPPDTTDNIDDMFEYPD